MKRTGHVLNSDLEEVQEQRKERIRKVCAMCKNKRSSSGECNHVTPEDDHHGKYMYEKLLVDEKHKVKNVT